MLECLGTQKHERALGEQELKCRKLEQKVVERQHEHEHECKQHQREQHEYCMLQMQMVMLQHSQGAPVMQNQLSFDGFGLLAELNDPTLSLGSSYST